MKLLAALFFFLPFEKLVNIQTFCVIQMHLNEVFFRGNASEWSILLEKCSSKVFIWGNAEVFLRGIASYWGTLLGKCIWMRYPFGEMLIYGACLRKMLIYWIHLGNFFRHFTVGGSSDLGTEHCSFIEVRNSLCKLTFGSSSLYFNWSSYRNLLEPKTFSTLEKAGCID